MSEALAAVETTTGGLQKLLIESALQDGGGFVHDDVHLTVTTDGVETLAATGGNTVMSSNVYEPGYFDAVDVDTPTEAIVSVQRTLDYLDVAGEGSIRVVLMGDPDDRLASHLRIEGALHAKIALPHAQSVLSKVPDQLPERFTEDHEFTSPSGNVHDVFVAATAGTLEQVIDAVELDPNTDLYPLAVADDDLTLDIGDKEDGRNAVWGALGASDVSWTDGVSPHEFVNHFGPGFEEVADTLDGGVELQLTEDAPMAVVSSGADHTVRHVITTTTTR